MEKGFDISTKDDSNVFNELVYRYLAGILI
jgi:hypothetical protein